MVSQSPSTASELLALWEGAHLAEPATRDDVLLAFAGGHLPASLGLRNAALMELRGALFGRSQALRCNCPVCGTVVDFSIDCASVADGLRPAAEAAGAHRLEHSGYALAYRLPEIADVRRAAAESATPEAFSESLLARCLISCAQEDGSPCSPEDLPQAVVEALSLEMEALEPGASLGFDLSCPACEAAWSAPMDPCAVLWAELQARVDGLLREVDALARAYGWSEPEILALCPARRAAYLQLSGAA